VKIKIKFYYEREKEEDEKGAGLPTATHVKVFIGNDIYKGSAYCHSWYDFPVKEIGRKLALTRAIASLPKDLRAEVWAKYHTR